MADLMDQGYQIALQNGGLVDTVTPSDPGLYAQLEAMLQEIQYKGCEAVVQEKYEIVCVLYPQMVKMYNNYFFPLFSFKDGAGQINVPFIRENIENGIYQSILSSLETSGIPSAIFNVNVAQYKELLTELINTVRLPWILIKSLLFLGVYVIN